MEGLKTMEVCGMVEMVYEGSSLEVKIVRHALDRIPLSLIIDDSAPLVNLNYFWLRDRVKFTGEHQRWEDVPVVIPTSFTREFAEWCAEHGVRGKYSVVPHPAALGRIDRGIAPFGAQIDDWLAMCREVICPVFDITPEMITHSFVVDPETLKPVEPKIWEQYEWEELPDLERTVAYIRKACEILENVGLRPQGVTSPGGFGGRSLKLYARAVGLAFDGRDDLRFPYFFKRLAQGETVETPIWFPDREQGRAVGEIIASTDDRTGSWTGYGEADPDYYITPDLEGGRLPAVLDAGQPGILCSHWQGFYGLHDEDRRGFKTLKEVVRRLRKRDPFGERTRWRNVSAIVDYSCMRQMAELTIQGKVLEIQVPAPIPELTIELRGSELPAKARANGKPLRPAGSRRDFASGTFLREETRMLLAFDPDGRQNTIEFL